MVPEVWDWYLFSSWGLKGTLLVPKVWKNVKSGPWTYLTVSWLWWKLMWQGIEWLGLIDVSFFNELAKILLRWHSFLLPLLYLLCYLFILKEVQVHLLQKKVPHDPLSTNSKLLAKRIYNTNSVKHLNDPSTTWCFHGLSFHGALINNFTRICTTLHTLRSLCYCYSTFRNGFIRNRPMGAKSFKLDIFSTQFLQLLKLLALQDFVFLIRIWSFFLFGIPFFSFSPFLIVKLLSSCIRENNLSNVKQIHNENPQT